MKPMKQIRVSASTPPASATDTTPSRHQVGRHRQRRGARAAGRHDGLARSAEAEHAADHVGVGGRKARRQRARHGRRDTARPLPVPRLGLEHAAADRADDQRGVRALGAADARVVERLARGRERESIGPGAPGRAPSVSGTSAAIWQRKPSVSIKVMGRIAQAPPLMPSQYGLDAGAERADDAEPRDGDGLHAPAVLDAMNRDRVSNDVK